MPVQYFSFGGLVNCLSAALLGLFVFSRKPHDIRHQTYAIFCFCLTVWSYGYFRWLMSDNAADALLWSRVLMAGAIFIPPTAFHHLVRLLDKKISHVFIAGNYVMSDLTMPPTRCFGAASSWPGRSSYRRRRFTISCGSSIRKSPMCSSPAIT